MAFGIGGGRNAANLFNLTYHDPFKVRIEAISKSIVDKKTAGTLKYEDVTAAQEELESEVEGLWAGADIFAGLGSNEAEAVAGARRTLEPIIRQWRASLEADLAGLPKPSTGTASTGPAAAPPTASTLLAPKGQTVSGQAAAAARRQRRDAGGMTRSTFLGSSSYGTQLQPKKTLLGY